MRLRKSTAVLKKTKALRHAIEFLEPRQLLTTVHGGDVFQYQDPAGNIDRVVLKGNITAELIGATVGPTGTVNLLNLPGQLNGVPVNGGLSGAAGTQLIGNITVTDTTVPAGSPQDNNAPVISALASTSTGVSYGLVITPITTTMTSGTSTTTTTSNLVQLVTINNTTAAATVVAELSSQIITAAGADFTAGTGMNAGPIQVTAVTAAAFSPTSGLLYFVATGGSTNTPVLFTVDVSSGVRATIQNTVTAIPGTFGAATGNVPAINAITFSSTGILYAVGTIAAGNNELFQVNTTNTDTITNPLPVMLGTAAAPGTITGIAFQAGSTTVLTAVDTIGGAAAGDVLSINVTTGAAVNFGSLASGTALGDNPGDLEFNPVLTDPFTGATGALVATDTGTHQLFYVFPQNRGGTAGSTLYAIYVSQADINASISVSQASSINGADAPFTGTIDLQVPSLTGTGTTTITGPAGIGTAVLGAVADVGGTAAAPTYVPYYSASVSQTFGVLPGSYSTLKAGLIVAPGQNLGNFLFGGTVLGNVNIQASIQTFYAGWLLTGNADGLAAGTITNPDNFVVDGDIRNLLVTGPIGTEAGTIGGSTTTAGTTGTTTSTTTSSTSGTTTTTVSPSYLTGFDMLVQGKVGQIQTLTPGNSPIVGSINVRHDPSVVGLTSPQLQTEFDTSDAFGGFDQGELAGSPLLDNNTFDTAQYLGSIDSSDLNANNVDYVSGTLNATTGNVVDYYAVPLLAGQTITVQLKPSIAGELDVGVFDPNDILIASDYNRQDGNATAGQTLQFTTQIPGVYRFAVTAFDNTGFALTTAATGSTTTTVPVTSAAGVVPYFMEITGVGDLGLGAIVASGGFEDNTISNTTTPGVGVANGDFGGVIAGGAQGASTTSGTSTTTTVTGGGGIESSNTQTFAVSNGNLRVITGTTIGALTTLDPEVAVPNGSVGLVQSTVGDIFFNHPQTTAPNTIGGSYQVVDAAENLGADLLADGSIGDIRAGQITDPLNSEFKVGVGGAEGQSIGLIESDGDFGTLMTGGPAISVGQGGHVGYISVPTGTIYRDDAFGGNEDVPFTYTAGATAQAVDSSGNIVTFTPSAAVTTTSTSTGTTGTTTSTTSTSTTTATLAPAGALSLTLYGIEGAGGSAIVRAISSESLSITAQENNSDQGIHIGEVVVQGSGAPVVDYTPLPGTTAVTSSITQPGVAGLPGLQLESGANLVPLTLDISGPAPVDVLNTYATSLGAVSTLGTASITALGNATSITNSTAGEMANVYAASIGSLSATGPLGSTQNSASGAAVLPRATASLGATGATGGTTVGNFYPFANAKVGVQVDGNILSISSNTSIGNVMDEGSIGRLSAGSGGIVGDVVASAFTTATTSTETGRILSVNIGGGIAAGGAGAPSSPGLYADSAIGPITGNNGANIYGAVISKFSVGSITLNGGGSIVDARIGDLTKFTYANQLPQVVTIPTNGSTVDKPVVNVGPIAVTGNGGIIGSYFWGSDIGTVNVNNGFGVLDSTFAGTDNGYFAGITAGGYGIRDVDVYGMSTVGTLNATGSGVNIATGNFSAAVLASDNGTLNQAIGIGVNKTNDLNSFLGTSASTPQIPGVTTTGLITDFVSRGAFNLGSVKAYEITSTQPAYNPSVFNFANSIGSIVTASQIIGVDIVTGKLGTFAPGGDVVETTLSIAGTIKSIVLRANFTQGSTITASGNNGFIKKLVIDGNMNGTISANRKITTVNITGTFSGSIRAAQIGSVYMGQGLGTGTLTVYGNINTMTIGGNLATAGNSLVINNRINSLKIAGNLNADISVGANLGQLIVGGSVTTGSTVTVGNVLNVLRVAGDVQAGSTIQAKKIKRKLVKGAIDGTIIG